MTWVKSRLVRPDGVPVVGQCVTATLVTQPTWLTDHSGQVFGVVRANSDHTGLWRMNLLPYKDFETAEFVYYQIHEGRGMPTWIIRVPSPTPTVDEYWMRDLLVEPPPPPESNWRPISTLGHLHNVDADVDDPPDGYVLGAENGRWGLIPHSLMRLIDVDVDSITHAKSGDQLVMLPSGKWGVFTGPFHLSVEWDADETYPTGVWVTVFGAGVLGARVHWGDGTPATDVMPDEPVRHVYPPGEATYHLVARDKAYPLVRGEATIIISEHVPTIHAYLDSDDDWRVLLWINEPADATKYLIDWGDGTTQVAGGQQKVPPRPRVEHQYQSIGQWPITVKNLASKRTSGTTVDTGDVGVAFTFDKGPYQPRFNALWLATGATAEVDSGDGSPPTRLIVPPSGRVNSSKSEPMQAGTYNFRISEIVDGAERRRTVRQVIIPNQWDWALNIWVAWRRDQMGDVDPTMPVPVDDTTEQIVRVQAKNARVDCLVTWGDGSAVQRVRPGEFITHTYALPMPSNGRLLRVEEDQNLLPAGVEKRVFTRLLGEPRYIGTPVLNARTNGAVDLDIAGIEGITNGDWYQVKWGDGSTVEEIGAIGRWYPAHHVYSAEGAYTITVDGPGMPKPITRTVEVVHYPSPSVMVTEDTQAADPQHLTALITVDNRDSGGPVLVRFGDGSTPAEVSETGSVSHRYPDPGPGIEMTHYVIAESKADGTAKGRKAVSVPFTDRTGSIEFQIGQYESDPYAAEVLVTKGNSDKQMVLDWGDGAFQDIPVGVAAHHVYTVAQTYSVTVGYDDGSESVTKNIDIPFTSRSAS